MSTSFATCTVWWWCFFLYVYIYMSTYIYTYIYIYVDNAYLHVTGESLTLVQLVASMVYSAIYSHSKFLHT